MSIYNNINNSCENDESVNELIIINSVRNSLLDLNNKFYKNINIYKKKLLAEIAYKLN